MNSCHLYQTKSKALGFLKLQGHDVNACGKMILEMVFRNEAHIPNMYGLSGGDWFVLVKSDNDVQYKCIWVSSCGSNMTSKDVDDMG